MQYQIRNFWVIQHVATEVVEDKEDTCEITRELDRDIVTEEPDPKKNGNENGKTSDPIEAEGAALEQDTLCYLK